MNLKDYFENAKGVLSTAAADGAVNVAVYARPYFVDSDDGNMAAFIMNERLSYANVQANPNAACHARTYFEFRNSISRVDARR